MEYFNQYEIYKQINPYRIRQKISELEDTRVDLIYKSVPRMSIDEQLGFMTTYARSVEVTAIDLVHVDNRIEKLKKQLEISKEMLDKYGNEFIDSCLRQQCESGQIMINSDEFDAFAKTVADELQKSRSPREISYIERPVITDYTHGGKYEVYYSTIFRDTPPISAFVMGKKGRY